MSAYGYDPRVHRYSYDGIDTYAFDGPDGSHHIVHPDYDSGQDRWVLSPTVAPADARRDDEAYAAWSATLPRFNSADEAIASVLGEPQS